MGKGRSIRIKKIHVVKQKTTKVTSIPQYNHHHRSITPPVTLSSQKIYEEYKKSQLLDLNSFLEELETFKSSSITTSSKSNNNPELLLKQSWDRLKEQLKLNDDIYHLKLLELKLNDEKKHYKNGRILDTKEIEYIELRNETLELIKPVDIMVNQLLNGWKRELDHESQVPPLNQRDDFTELPLDHSL